tara:strand:- start:445 stop:978 length:534 start_codon:yes stop_codon:yes gene_type:complete
MKITRLQLRRLIREAIDQDEWREFYKPHYTNVPGGGGEQLRQRLQDPVEDERSVSDLINQIIETMPDPKETGSKGYWNPDYKWRERDREAARESFFEAQKIVFEEALHIRNPERSRFRRYLDAMLKTLKGAGIGEANRAKSLYGNLITNTPALEAVLPTVVALDPRYYSGQYKLHVP